MATHILRRATLVAALLCLTGCADMYVIERKEVFHVRAADTNGEDTNDEPAETFPEPTDITMAKAEEYANNLKTAATNHGMTQFNVGQGVTGAVVAAATAATALLAINGDEATAAAVGLGAGALGLGDRFLLVDESLSLYSAGAAAIDCGLKVFEPLSSNWSTNSKLTAFRSDTLSFFSSSKDTVALWQLVGGEPANDDGKATGVPGLQAFAESAIASNELFAAMEAGKDKGSDPVAWRMVQFIEQVRHAMNLTLLKKRATPEEIMGAFNTSVAAYVAKMDALRKKAEEKNKQAQAVQQAQVATLGRLTIDKESHDKLAAIQLRQAQLDALLAEASSKIPDESALLACVLQITGASAPPPAKPAS
jgi:hypothetical protein